MPIAFEELTLHYQPQVAADGSRIVAAEALLRVLRPTPRLVRPADVIDLFNAADEGEALDLWVFRRAAADSTRWPSLTVSVNLSAPRFVDPALADKLLALVAETGADPRRIEIEIVETAYIGDFERASETLRGLRAAGFRIAIDDFGTGYSSLGYLLRLPVDKLKIDKCFVDDVTTMTAAAIVQAMVALSRALGLKVTAEGVETVDQWRILKASGCHYMQGWLFAKAMDAEALDALVAEGRSLSPLARPGAA